MVPAEGSSEGSELTKEIFRWDQRLFTVLLQLPGLFPVGPANAKAEKGNSDRRSALSDLCESTGGLLSVVVLTLDYCVDCQQNLVIINCETLVMGKFHVE